MSGEFGGRFTVRSLHFARRARACSLRQRSRVRRQGGAGADRGGGREIAFFEPGSPWKSGYCEGFNSKLRDELLNGELFYSLVEARIVIKGWRQHYNTRRPHSSLGYKPPAPPPCYGRLRKPNQFRRPPQPWPPNPPCIKLELGHVMGAGYPSGESRLAGSGADR